MVLTRKGLVITGVVVAVTGLLFAGGDALVYAITHAFRSGSEIWLWVGFGVGAAGIAACAVLVWLSTRLKV